MTPQVTLFFLKMTPQNNQDLKNDPQQNGRLHLTKRPAPKGTTGIVNTSK